MGKRNKKLNFGSDDAAKRTNFLYEASNLLQNIDPLIARSLAVNCKKTAMKKVIRMCVFFSSFTFLLE